MDSKKEKGVWFISFIGILIFVGYIIFNIWACGSSFKSCNDRRREERIESIVNAIENDPDEYLGYINNEALIKHLHTEYRNGNIEDDDIYAIFGGEWNFCEWMWDSGKIESYVLDRYSLEDVKYWYEERGLFDDNMIVWYLFDKYGRDGVSELLELMYRYDIDDIYNEDEIREFILKHFSLEDIEEWYKEE